jgi:hypothetical protein
MLHTMYDQHKASTSWSWERLNQALRATLHALITVGASFALEDFVSIADDGRLSFGSWAGTDNAWMYGEQFYRAAVHTNNRSACLAFEHWKQRKPFIYEGARLFVGAQISWEGEAVTCTSFAKDGSAVTLCSYKSTDYDPCPTCRIDRNRYTERKVLHRYTITYEMLHPSSRRARVAPVKSAATV